MTDVDVASKALIDERVLLEWACLSGFRGGHSRFSRDQEPDELLEHSGDIPRSTVVQEYPTFCLSSCITSAYEYITTPEDTTLTFDAPWAPLVMLKLLRSVEPLGLTLHHASEEEMFAARVVQEFGHVSEVLAIYMGRLFEEYQVTVLTSNIQADDQLLDRLLDYEEHILQEMPEMYASFLYVPESVFALGQMESSSARLIFRH